MPLAGTFARVGLIGAVGLVVGISTLGALLKQTSPVNTTAGISATPFSSNNRPVTLPTASETVTVTPAVAASEVIPKPAAANLTLDEPARATPQPDPPPAVVTAVSAHTERSDAPASSFDAAAAPAPVSDFPEVQPLTD